MDTVKTTTRLTLAEGPSAYAVLNKRLEDQRTLIFQVQGICGLASHAARDTGQQLAATDVWTAMDAVHALLEKIGSALDPAEILDAELTEDEMSLVDSLSGSKETEQRS